MGLNMKQLMGWEGQRQEHGAPKPIANALFWTVCGCIVLVHERSHEYDEDDHPYRNHPFYAMMMSSRGYEKPDPSFESTLVKGEVTIGNTELRPGVGVKYNLDGTPQNWETSPEIYQLSLMRPLTMGEVGFLFSAVQPVPKDSDPRKEREAYPWRY